MQILCSVLFAMRTFDAFTACCRTPPDPAVTALPNHRTPFGAHGRRGVTCAIGHADESPPYPANGFTLLELIVVILLLTILLGFAIPAFKGSILTGSQESVARELMSAVKKLKIAALRRQSVHTLHLNLDQGRLWVTQEKTADDQGEAARQSEWDLPDNTRIAQVRFPGDREVHSGTVEIRFYPQGYSDRAIVRLAGDGKKHTDLVIEAFLPMAMIASEDEPPAF